MRHYRCQHCGRERGDDNLSGVRVRQPCPECDAVTVHERV